MNKRFLLLAFFIITSSNQLYATTGGPQFLTFLGQRDSSLYFIYEFHDESANPPQLWEYNLSLDSLIINDDWLNYPDESVSEGLKRMFVSELDTNGIQISDSIIFTFKDPMRVYYDEYKEYLNEFPVVVTWGSNEFHILQCFEDSTRPNVMASKAFPKLGVSMAIIRYKGVCIEIGYEKDTLLIKEITIEVAENEIEQNENKLLIISLMILAIGLMVYIFLKRKHHKLNKGKNPV